MSNVSMYLHRDEDMKWRWYFYTVTGMCFMSRQAFASEYEAVNTMQEYDDE